MFFGSPLLAVLLLLCIEVGNPLLYGRFLFVNGNWEI